ncbi:NUDIX hydrolase [Candidatus Woesearchaeota archaeon]|jgi:ADP-ribose pyrophosphatase YjhB (NUDIX family)|nr:NUDIX hydrolase [Candidatus Woesearchaeota archaeon]
MVSEQLAGCLILKNDGLLLVRKKNKDYFELPSGTFSEKNNPEEIAINETTKQTGIKPLVLQQFGIVEFREENKNCEVVVYECSVDPSTSELIPGENMEEVKWIKFAEIKNIKVSEEVSLVIDEL